jgi:hypothetical protein
MRADAARAPSLSAHDSYTMTSGAKFGGDFLAYPGDPLLYHAQFTVRCLRADAPQHPLGLAAAARMAHAARCVRKTNACCVCHTALREPAAADDSLNSFAPRSKHVVLASIAVDADGMPLPAASIEYITLSPDIQQSTNRERPTARGGAPRGRPAHAA